MMAMRASRALLSRSSTSWSSFTRVCRPHAPAFTQMRFESTTTPAASTPTPEGTPAAPTTPVTPTPVAPTPTVEPVATKPKRRTSRAAAAAAAAAAEQKPATPAATSEEKPAGTTTEGDGTTKPAGDTFSSTEFGTFEAAPAGETPAAPVKPKRKKKEKPPQPVPEHLSSPAEQFKYRLLMARIEGPDAMKAMETEIEENFQKGENEKNTTAIEQGLFNTQWQLRPLGFHSMWLWSIARKYCGDKFAVKYLLQTRKTAYKWHLSISTRQLILWRECVDDLIKTSKPALDSGEITVSNLIDIIAVFYVDSAERNQYTYLEDQITGYKTPHGIDIFKVLQETLEDKHMPELWSKFVVDFPEFIKLCTEEQILEVLRPALARMTEDGKKQVADALDSDQVAVELRSMPNVRELVGLPAKAKPLPPPPEPAPAAATTDAKPADGKPADAKTDAKPADAKPADAKTETKTDA